MSILNNKNSDIEVLRGCAILLTLLGHLVIVSPVTLPGLEWLQQHFAFWSGVDLFFCISGFVITQSLLRAPEGSATGSLLKKFWIKRVFRLLPSAWLWIAIALLLAAVMPPASGFVRLSDMWAYAAVAFFNVANFFSAHFVATQGGVYLSGNPLAHYWSLSTEEQFYIVVPLLILMVPRKALVIAMAAGILLQFNLDRVLFSLGWYCRTDALMWGVLLGLLFESKAYQRLDPVFLRPSFVGSCCFIALLLLLAWITLALGGFDFAAGRGPASCALGAIALVCAVLVFIASFDRNYLLPTGNGKRLMVWVGERSYSLYVVHHIVFMAVAAFYKLPQSAPAHEEPLFMPVMVALALSLLLTELNYRFIELPVREYGRRLASGTSA